ncbi:MAG: YARHG domain-containing protein [Cyclobacteriaceae bacterium]|nr:YARHG domain-containing protein [Cyclobacteriaceae bacterium]
MTYGQDLVYNSSQEIDFLTSIGQQFYKQIDSNKKKKLYLNNLPIDSSGLSFNDLIVLTNSSKVYGYSISDGLKRNNFYSIDNNILKSETSIDYLFVPSKQYLINTNIFAIRDKKLLLINPNNWQVSELLDIRKVSYDYQPIEVAFSKADKVLIEYGENVGGGYDVYGFLVYDLKTQKTWEVTQDFRKFLPIDKVTDLTKLMIFTIQNDKHLYFKIPDEKPGKGSDEFVFDVNFNFIGRSLEKEINQVGVNVVDNKVKSCNVFSKSDKSMVVIEYTPRYDLDKIFYKMFYDSVILNREIKFKKSDLELLKNFIFAKHNYQFTSEYYQAYFNLFSFYGSPEKLKTRTKDVNKHLSDADKKNLALINSMLKNAK